MTGKIIRWSLFAVIILYIVSGFGITQFRVVETITFGLLSKPLSFRIHDYLLILFLVLLVLHVFMSPLKKLLHLNKKSD